MAITTLQVTDLYRSCDAQTLDFDNTNDLEVLDEIIGQPRAIEAVKFGIGIRRKGFNLFALGPAGSGKHAFVQNYATQQAAKETMPPDQCYINNFKDASKPSLLQIPSGRGVGLQHDMEQLIEDLYCAIPGIFESSEYRTRSQTINDHINAMHESALKNVRDNAEHKSIALVETPNGFTLAPVRGGKTLKLAEIEKLPASERQQIEQDTEELQKQLAVVIQHMPKLQKLGRDRTNQLNRDMVAATVSHLFEPLLTNYTDLPAVIAFIRAVEADVASHFRHFLSNEEHTANVEGLTGKASKLPYWVAWKNRYRVNVLVSHRDSSSAPVVYEDLPSYNNLIGRVEHQALLGALVTDFTMIRPGALHRANGGYLILDAVKVLTQPFAWEGLKRVLQSGQICIESLAQMTSLISTVSVQPEPVPLIVKVILLGERHIYSLLSSLDPEFGDLFKVAVDFSDRMPRTEESQRDYARLIAGIIHDQSLCPFDRSAVARVIEQSSRLLGDSEMLAVHMRSISDLLQEADYWAQQRKVCVAEAQDVQKAIATRDYRMSQVREHIQEQIRRGTLLIDIEGERIGCVNGLSVLIADDLMFGQPSRITATVRSGERSVVDIEREVELGGPIHSKGVLILSAYIGSQYVPNKPLVLSASLVFEQSYNLVEGDSASSAELYALLSALAGVPLKQSLAITGSVNQQGDIQPIGGVNEKIEGFFDVCQQQGLNGQQGVIIPSANIQHLMLRQDVRNAVADGQFSIHAIDTVNDGLELLTGMTAGERDVYGVFPNNSINSMIEDTLVRYAEQIRDFNRATKIENEEQSTEY